MAIVHSYSLQELQEALTAVLGSRAATQQLLSRISDVDQPTISRAKNGKIKRRSRKTDALMEACKSLRSKPPIGPAVAQKIHIFYAKGGSEAELLATIEHGASLVSGEMRASTSTD